MESLANTGAPKQETASEVETKSFTGITNIQDARNVLTREPYNVPLDELKNKTAIRKAAKEKGVSFPNLA